MDNANTREYLDKIRTQVVENLKRTAFAPSVQMTDVPRDPLVDGMDDEAEAILDDLDEDENKDKRFTKRRFDQYIEKPGELSDSEDEDENAANGVSRKPAYLKRRDQVSHRLDLADSGAESGIATPQDASSAVDEEMDLGGDARMTEAPEAEAEAEAQGTSSASQPPARGQIGSIGGPHEIAAGAQELAPTSVPVSGPDSPRPADEDITMEDADNSAATSVPERALAPSEPKEDKAVETASASAIESTSQLKTASALNSEEQKASNETAKEAEPTETATTQTTEGPRAGESPAVNPKQEASKAKEPSSDPQAEAARREE
jgi:histone deacetylase 1/2